MLPTILFNEAKRLETSLRSFRLQGQVETFTLKLDCTTLPKYGHEGDCRYHITMTSFFKPLLSISQPTIYWFEIISSNSAKDLHDKIKGLKAQIDRNVPAFKKHLTNLDSRVLYVGKVKKDIAGRMVTHLGYYTNKNTQGLQLCHWAQGIGLRLKLNYILLPLELADLAVILEKRFAKELHPIFGKHK